jgi:ATPase subunit of ABC transporter with duplicated ATPase domains
MPPKAKEREIESEYNINYSTVQSNDELILKIKDFDMSFYQKQLLNGTELKIVKGTKYALIGPNGVGKTTLLNMIDIKFDLGISVYLVKQEAEIKDEVVLLSVLESHKEYYTNKMREFAILEDVEKLESEIDYDDEGNLTKDGEATEEQINKLNDELNELIEFAKENDFRKLEAKASKILFGLGFTGEMQKRRVSNYSGGWVMRINLAKALFQNPKLLLLDEPTNHLDLDACIWLEDYLQSWKGTLIIVSHDKDFVDEVSNKIVEINKGKLLYYDGGYRQYLKMKQQEADQIRKEWNKVRKNVKNKKERDRKRPDREYKPKFNIKVDEDIVDEFRMLHVKNMGFTYPETNTEILSHVNFSLSSDDRIVLVGANGSGKSTFLKLIMKRLKPTSGDIEYDPRYTIGYYTQHFFDSLPNDKTPVQYLMENFKWLTNEEETRKELSRYNLDAKSHKLLIEKCSGGQKSRIALAYIGLLEPEFLLLDEPTNHLDMESIDALIDMINNFKGGVLVVTHDGYLIDNIHSRLYYCHDKTVDEFKTGFNGYKRYLLQKLNSFEEVVELKKNKSGKNKGRKNRNKTTNTTEPKSTTKVDTRTEEEKQEEINKSLDDFFGKKKKKKKRKKKV